jgi:hypothetical protein
MEAAMVMAFLTVADDFATVVLSRAAEPSRLRSSPQPNENPSRNGKLGSRYRGPFIGEV